MTRHPLSRRSLALLPVALAAARAAPAVARAGQATPTAAAGRVLLEATFAADELPAGDAQGFFFRLTLPPGATLSYLAGPFCGCPGQEVTPAVGAELVLSGSYAVRLGAPFRVVRADGAEEEVAVGSDAVLDAGDGAVFPDYAAPGEIRAAGSEPAVVVGVAVAAAAGSGTPAPRLPVAVEGEQLATLSALGWGDVATGGPVALRLRRLELPVGGALGPYESAAAEAMLVEAGEVGGGILQPGQDSPPGEPLAYPEGSTLPFVSLQPGFRRLVANGGDAPAVLLVAAIAPAEPAGATPAG